MNNSYLLRLERLIESIPLRERTEILEDYRERLWLASSGAA